MLVANEVLGFTDVKKSLALYRITDNEIRVIQAFSVEGVSYIRDFINDFYRWLPNVPEFKALFVNEALVEQVKRRQVAYWEQLFRCELNQAYIKSRLLVGDLHANIRLPISSYVAGMSFAADWWIDKISQTHADVKGAAFLISALNKLFTFDIAIVSASYTQVSNSLVEKQSRALIEASLDPLVTISPKGIITDVNQATMKVTGLDRADIIGTDFSDYFTDPEHARRGYQQVLELGQVTDYALTIRHYNGTLTDVLYNASVYRNNQGDVLGVFAAARDVTDAKRATVRLESLAQQLATGATGQSKGSDQVSDAIGKMAIALQQMSDIAKIAAEKATATVESAKIAGQTTEHIESVVESITRISDQTNLLALNAAIEAARAGDAGRGFAVVADEVRKLSEDSKQFAAEINTVVQNISKDIRATVDAIQLVSHNITDVATGIQQQSIDTQQIVVSMRAIADIAEQNTDLAGEILSDNRS
ncbi:MAG: methyl-accepting chemotaxis protein [Coxiellaceae bacterium]|nr:methyl-accepting chemotaxis protein [Coxiellaceae bacterium]